MDGIPSSPDSNETAEPAIAHPVRPGERYAELDLLRGFALLGILVINIEFFALPSSIYFDPAVIGGFTGLDLLTWKLAATFFLQKMMAVFSMLFGAGMLLMIQRWQSQGVSQSGRLFFRRNLWLLVIGLFHAYFIWHGDILVSYALCAFLLYMFRNRSTRALVISGVVVLAIGMFLFFAIGLQLRFLRDTAREVESAAIEQREVKPYQESMANAWRMIDSAFTVTPERLEEEIADYRGSYFDTLKRRAGDALMMQTQAFFFYALWRSLGMMLIGMALLKTGVLTGGRSLRFYVILAVVGLGLGWPLSALGAESMINSEFDIVESFIYGQQLGYIGSALAGLGYVGALIAISRLGMLRWLRERLAAVGRTAFSNYLLQSLICTTLFYGYGFGLFAQLNRSALFGVVVAVWLVNIFATQLWLRRYQMGPAEWLWRSLTYGRSQPLRINQPSV